MVCDFGSGLPPSTAGSPVTLYVYHRIDTSGGFAKHGVTFPRNRWESLLVGNTSLVTEKGDSRAFAFRPRCYAHTERHGWNSSGMIPYRQSFLTFF